jgi:23S rRNA pseudouridine1911/1915/1917 synthase
MDSKIIKFIVTEDDINTRLDIALAKRVKHLTRSNLKKIIESKKVKINNDIIILPSKKLKLDELITVNLETNLQNKIKASKIELDILYEDKDILIINKPAGMVVHPGAGNYENTLVNALIFKYKKNLSNINGDLRPGIVHRIDKETSGILVVAKNNLAHSKIGDQFSKHTIKRKYLALVWGVVRPLNGKIKTLISRSKKNRQLMSVSEVNGKQAITNYQTIKVFDIKNIPKISLLECQLETGRTHQIRVHFSYKNNPLLGDKQYGKKNIKFKKVDKDFETKLKLLNRQALHAKSLGFIHPTSKKFISFDSKIPNDYKKLLDLLNKLSD